MAISGFEVERSHSGLFSRNYERIRVIVESEPSEDNASRLIRELERIPNWEKDETAVGYYSAYLKKCEAARNSGALRIVEETRIKKGLFYDEVSRTLVIERAAAPVKVADNKRGKTATDALPDGKKVVPLPKELLQNQGLREQLQKLGILQGNNVVFENPDWEKDFRHYVDLLAYLKKIPYKNSRVFKNTSDRKKVVANYLELANESKTFWLLDKKYLELQYATAIYNDIVGQGCFLEKDKNGIFQIKRTEPNSAGGYDIVSNPLPEYAEILNGANQNKLMDVAILVAMMENNFTYDKEVVGQKSLIYKILEQNNIQGKNGAIQTPEALKLDWDFIKPQIEAKRKAAAAKRNGQSYQVFQELTYVLNFMENEEYKKPQYSEEVLSLANVYRLQFRGEKGALDAMQRAGFDPQNPETWGDTMKRIAAENAPLAIIAGIFLTFFGGDTFGSLGKGLLAGLVGAFIGGDILNAVGGAKKGTKKYFTGEQLELFDFSQIKVETRFSTPNYTNIYNKLAAENEKRKKSYNTQQGGTVSRAPALDNNFYIAKIMHELLAADIDGGDLTPSDTNAASVLAKIPVNKRKIDGSEFGNIEGNLIGKEITKEHIKIFLSLLGSTKEANDTTIRDALEVGRDPLAEIKAKAYTGDPYFDPAINSLFSDGYSGLSRANKKKRQELQALFETELKGANKAKVDTFVAKLTSEGYAQKFIDIASDFSWHLEIMEKLSAVRVPASFGQNEIALEQGIITLDTLETQRNAIASDRTVQANLSANPELFKSISEKIDALKIDIANKKTKAQTDLASIQSAELAKDSAAKFGGDKGGSVVTALVGKDANYFRNTYEGSNTVEIQKLRENIRELVKYLNQRYTDIENASDLSSINTIISDANVVEAFKILSNLKTGIGTSTVTNFASRKYLKDIANTESQKYTDGIYQIMLTKKTSLESSAQSITTRINGISITQANIEQSGIAIGALRGEINAIKAVNLTIINQNLRAIGVADIGALSVNIGQLEQALLVKEQEIETIIDGAIQTARNASGQEIQDVLKLATLHAISNLSGSSKTKLEQAQKELLARLETNTQISGISQKITELKALKSEPKVAANIKVEIDTQIGKLRTKFMSQSIDRFVELELNGSIITAFTTSLLSQASQIATGQANPAQDALTKITGTPSPSLKDFNDLVQRFSLSSTDYTNFLRSKNLID